jgi:hypothetical protein
MKHSDFRIGIEFLTETGRWLPRKRERVQGNAPVNSREKTDNLRISGGPPYIPSRLAAAPDLTENHPCALRLNSSMNCAPGFRFRKSWAGA